ncbi:hypothetical protein BDK51DRAFT_25451 [Blyttiomyces helicus]|uniref:Uncharacterized protein n=1 Tax=Blyttiomyces helicus TaxID=388810 RepID=A0A4P9W8M8_9FUNG|nr:hypothetical protein BDK51DRAFT_25451 [Blyttiomyces helicus]|eukprot:RKO88714.1 hypothetical protein BDK51DRAFT_25451 [Blyttiomyces helicus]
MARTCQLSRLWTALLKSALDKAPESAATEHSQVICGAEEGPPATRAGERAARPALRWLFLGNIFEDEDGADDFPQAASRRNISVMKNKGNRSSSPQLTIATHGSKNVQQVLAAPANPMAEPITETALLEGLRNKAFASSLEISNAPAPPHDFAYIVLPYIAYIHSLCNLSEAFRHFTFWWCARDSTNLWRGPVFDPWAAESIVEAERGRCKGIHFSHDPIPVSAEGMARLQEVTGHPDVLVNGSAHT